MRQVRRLFPVHGMAFAQQGFALPATLFLLVMVSALLLDSALRLRTDRQFTWNGVVDLRARMASRAGVGDALSRLRALQRQTNAFGSPAPDAAERWNKAALIGEQIDTIHLPSGSSYHVDVYDTGSRLPLNFATEEELRILFLGIGVNFDDADVAAQSIADWRDADNLHRARGAEYEDYYRRQRHPVRPNNGPFEAVVELRDVRGMETLYNRVAPYLTVNGDGRVNLNTASAPVLLTLPGFTDEAVQLVLSRRRIDRPVRTLFELESELSEPALATLQANFSGFAQRASFEPSTLEITSVGWGNRGSALQHTAQALVVRSGSSVEIARSVER